MDRADFQLKKAGQSVPSSARLTDSLTSLKSPMYNYKANVNVNTTGSKMLFTPTFLEIPHENEIIYAKLGFEQTPRTPSGSATPVTHVLSASSDNQAHVRTPGKLLLHLAN